MTREVFYRKWRPQTFAELAGQEAVARTLTNAVSGGKVAHAYLFSGPRGTGKTTTGRLLAKAVNCGSPKDGEPCNECESCLAYLANAAEKQAFQFIELDAASNRGIDEIRNLREKAMYGGGNEATKIYLIDEVHMLTEPAFNALLKTLEEPPPHVIFVLATTEAHKVPPTVVSRCQRFDFRRIPLAAIVDRLSFVCKQEAIDCPADALEVIARSATGSLRDGINLLEQLVDSYGKALTPDQVREGLGLVVDPRAGQLSLHALRGELAEGLALISSVRDDGLDLRQFQRQVVADLRGLLLAKAEAPPSDAWTETQLAEKRGQVADVPPARIVEALRAFGEADLRADPLSPLPLELALAGLIAAPPRPSAPAPAPAQPAPQRSRRPPEAERPAPAEHAAQKAVRPVPAQSAGRTTKRPDPAPARNAQQQEKQAGGEREPERAASPEPQAGVSAANGDSPELAEVRGRWQEIYDRTRELQYRAGALLNSGCGIISASENEVVFGFRHQMHLDRMQGDGGENLQALQQAVEDVLGAGRTVRCVLEPDVDVQRPGRGGHLVRAAEELGGQVLPEDD